MKTIRNRAKWDGNRLVTEERIPRRQMSRTFELSMMAGNLRNAAHDHRRNNTPLVIRYVYDSQPAELVSRLARIKALSSHQGQPEDRRVLHANDTFGTAQRQAMDRLLRPPPSVPCARVHRHDRAQICPSRSPNPRAQPNPPVVTAPRRIKLVRDMVRQRFEPWHHFARRPGLTTRNSTSARPLADYHA